MSLIRGRSVLPVVQPGFSTSYRLLPIVSTSKKVIKGVETRRKYGRDLRPSQIAILGGGITGLSAAYFASRRFPSASITLLEESSRLGGLIGSIHATLENGNTMICETGPRTLRPHNPRAIATFELVSCMVAIESIPLDNLHIAYLPR